MNKLIINQRLVELETDIEYKAIELHYNGKLYIENLLPQDYIVSKNNSKIIIVKFNKREEILTELFNYNGYCKIIRGFLVDKDLQKHNLTIETPTNITWHSLKSNWEKITTNWESMGTSISNKYSNNFKITSKTDPDTNVVTTTRETFQTSSNLEYRDVGLTRLSDFDIDTNKTKKSLKKGQQIKKGY
tara:strand:+ start:132 stop:695 length:564 start_codon:yes stop_codon:yes gene_type:complete